MDKHARWITTAEERRKNQLGPVAEVTVTDAVVDDLRKIVFLIFSSREMDIDEHGLMAVCEQANWRLEDDSFLSGYIAEATAPKGHEILSSTSLLGTWQADENGTAELLRNQGEPEDFIRMHQKALKGLEWVITESRVIQKRPNFHAEYDLISAELKRGVYRITVNAHGLAAPEI